MFASKDELFTRPSGGYTIARSVRLRSSATAYFNRTLTTPTNNTTWTISAWVKRGSLGVAQTLFGAAQQSIEWVAGNGISIYSAGNPVATSTAVYRDPSAWYHFVINSNGTTVTVYANNQSVLTYTGTLTSINSAISHTIGKYANASADYLDGYITEINFIDGQALTPSSFGTTNTTTGVWQPAKYTGTYGTNGFYLNFSDNSSNTATTIGKDYSGNGNNWTPNNISVTAGATYDSMTDVPTLTSATVANYPTWNPLVPSGQAAPTDGNLSQINSTGCRTATMQFPQSGKWYLEWLAGSNTMAIVVGLPFVPTTQANSQTYSVGYYNNGNKYIAGTATSYGASFTSGDIIGLALDFTVSPPTITYYKNNASQGAINLTSGIDYVVAAGIGGTGLEVINFGQRPFSYTPPTGFVALNTYNLPASTITNGAAYMAATTYTGTGANRSISNAVNGVSFQPDFVWVKNRTNAYDHDTYDSLRPQGSRLITNLTNAEGGTTTVQVNSFNSDGFGLGTYIGVNESGSAFVGWQWKASNTTASNTNGSITSTVSAGATQGFSVVTYTGTGANATVGHGLGVAPSMIICKSRSSTYNWVVYHVSLGNTANLKLNTTDAQTTGATTSWNSTSPTSTVFSLGSSLLGNDTNPMVAYCFSAVAGYSAFGSYTGNGSTDGPFIYTGFRPRFVLLKDSTNAASNWQILDTSRDIYNVAPDILQPNLSNAESAFGSGGVDFLSNGFKIRTSSASINTTSAVLIYACFAENPFKNSLAR